MAVQEEQVEPDDRPDELRVRLKNELARKGLTVTQAARRARLGRTTVHEALQSDGQVPTARTVAALASALGLPQEELLDLRRTAAGETGAVRPPLPEPGTSEARTAETGPQPPVSGAPQRRVRRPVVLAVLAVVVTGGAVTTVTLMPDRSSPPSAEKTSQTPLSQSSSPGAAPASASASPAARSTNSPRPGPTGPSTGHPVSGPPGPTTKQTAAPAPTGHPAQPAAQDQAFSPGDTTRLQNVSTRQCISTKSGNDYPTIETCSTSQTHPWTLRATGGGSFTLATSADGRCLKELGTYVPTMLGTCTDSPSTGYVHWHIASTTTQGQTLKNDHFGQCLAIGPYYGAPSVMLIACNPNDTSQQWTTWRAS